MTKEGLRKRLGEKKYARVIEFAKKAMAKRKDPDEVAKAVAKELKARFPDLSAAILNEIPRSL